MAYLRSVNMPFLFQLQFTSSSFLWLLVCLFLGLAYAYLMYRQKLSDGPLIKWLFAFRTIAVALISFLLFAPMIKFIGSTKERPLIIIAQDNSSSIAIAKPSSFRVDDYNADIKKLADELSRSYDVRSLSFGAKTTDGLRTDFRESLTDINSVFKQINEQYANRNIGAVIIATDGIYNHGGNPEYEAQSLKAPIYSIALGDTVAKRDVLVSNVNYNNIVYLDNDFQIEVSVEAYQCKGASSRLTVSAASGQVFSRQVAITSNEFRTTIPVTLSAKKKGIQRYTVSLSPVSAEISTQNNKQTFFVEVIDGKNKVVIVANAPHPDIAALKQSIEANKNYEVKSAFVDDFKAADIKEAGLIILHQLPSVKSDARAILQSLAGKPIWFILGAQTNSAAFSASQTLLTINSTGAVEESTASRNSNFYDFTLADQALKQIQNLAPLITPFGSYSIKADASVLFNQQIGKVITSRPLLVFSKGSPVKTAVLAGEGIWRWRLEDFKETGTHQAVDQLVAKITQFMLSKDDKRKFRVYAAKNTFDESEHVVVNAELYNDNYELVNTPDVSITLKSADKKTYPFLFTRTNNSYVLDAGLLPAGEYSYSASTQLGKVKHTAAGQFAIVQQQLESRQTTSNHQLLHNLSELNDGEVIYPEKIGELINKIRKNELIKTVAYEDRKYEELISLKTIFFLILSLLALEWFLRKRAGFQ